MLAHNYYESLKWIPAGIIRITGRLSYMMKTAFDIILCSHVDQLRYHFSGSNGQDSVSFKVDELPMPNSTTNIDIPSSPTVSSNSSTLLCFTRVHKPIT